MGRLLTGLAVCVLLVGCASAPPVTVKQAGEQTTYETKRILLSGTQSSAGYGSGPRFYTRVVGKCSGANCTPSGYVLRFTFESQAQREIELQSRNVVLRLAEQTLRWSPTRSGEAGRTLRIRNPIVEVNLTRGELEAIAAVSDVRGALGGMDFRLPYDARSPLRALVERTSKSSNGGA